MEEIKDENKKKIKKRRKIKKKALILIPILILVLIIVIIFTIYKTTETTKNIKKHYNKYVITTRKTTLYKEGKKVGTISKNYKLELDNIKNISLKNTLLKIKDTEYQVSYKDIKKIKEIEPTTINENIIVLNKNITSKQKVTLKNNKNRIELNNLNLEVLYIKNNKYYVNFLNNIFEIEKNKNIIEVKKNNSKEKETKEISILNYENIENSCRGLTCTNTKDVITQINLLKENKYYFITQDELEAFLDNNIRLKDKAILLTTNNANEETKKIEEQLNIKIENTNNIKNINFTSTNKKTTNTDDKKNVNRYEVKSYTTKDNILKMANKEEVYEVEPLQAANVGAQSIAVINYHFFYDPEQQQYCDEVICLTTQKFREHLEYIKNNGFYTVTMNEFTRWMYGEIYLPEKSVLLTVDDGAKGTGRHNGNQLIPLLEEYKMHATLFLIAGWWDIENYRSEYLDIQSHTFDMHKVGGCGRGQLVCANYDQAKEDLQKSLNIIGNNDSFCYPFYQYSNESIRAIKDLGFRIAFGGGNRKARRSDNKYIIPRYPIQHDSTVNQFASMIN